MAPRMRVRGGKGWYIARTVAWLLLRSTLWIPPLSMTHNKRRMGVVDKPVLILSQSSTFFPPAHLAGFHLSAFPMGIFSTFSCSFTQLETPPLPPKHP